MTQFPDLFAALFAPFAREEIKTRTQGGKQLRYITARTAMNRLDDVLGPENWWDEYVAGENSVLCRLTIRLPDGSLLTKSDAGGYAGMPDSGDDDKSGYSDAFKRAAVKLGVGRYLYRDGVPAFAVVAAPAPAERPAPPAPAPPPAKAPRDRPYHGNLTPRNPRELYAWAGRKQNETGLEILRHLDRWGRSLGYPARIRDWDAGQVVAAVHEVIRLVDEADHRQAGAA